MGNGDGSSLKLKESTGREGAQISVESRRPEGARKFRSPHREN